MKNILPLLSFLILLASCSSNHYLKQAQFDPAIYASVKKLRKNPNKDKEISTLKYAYNKANELDKDRLDFLYASGEENIWEEAHNRYTSLYTRQQLVKTLPDNVLSAIDYQYVNYAEKITQTKQNAAAYHYELGLDLLEQNDKYKAREAYTSFATAKSYYPNYKDLTQKLYEAQYLGTNHVLFRMVNESQTQLPEDFENELLKISLKDLNGKWIDYDTKDDGSTNYDYYIQLSLRNIMVSPEENQTNTYTEEKEIEDGFKYQLDANGNVQKDTAGNDIKLPIYKIITCNVVETIQHKEALITGTVDYIDTYDGQLMKTHPVTAQMIFDHKSYATYGNVEALKNETRSKIGLKALPYPSDAEMLLDAAGILKENTKQIIYANGDWLMN